MRGTEPGIVIAVNESDEAKATGGTLDCSVIICSDRKQMRSFDFLLNQGLANGVAFRLSSYCF